MSLRWAVPVLAALVVAGIDAMGVAAAGDARSGAQAFQPCGACHTVTPGGAAVVGPNLWGVVGRDVASMPGFDYSEQLRSVGGAWTAEQLDRFLADPAAFAPGTRMGYVGVADPAERAALIAYLSTLREGASAPAAEAKADFGTDWPEGPGQMETGVLCNACHSLAIVKQQRLSREVWDKLLVWMVEEQGMAEQAPERRALILEYLATHFGPG